MGYSAVLMSKLHSIAGLVAATHTPFHPDGTLNLKAVEAQAERLLLWNVTSVFIGGSTGESHSLTLDERRALTKQWMEVTRDTPMQVIVHTGSNCIEESAILATQAAATGAAAVSALAPSYFKPQTTEALISCCLRTASAAPDLPFYFYHIPGLTGVSFPMTDFLEKAAVKIPNLAGIKFSAPDLMTCLQCLQLNDQKWDILWGTDEWLLGALAIGVQGAVGSSYNFAAPLYHRMIAAFNKGDLATARLEQFRSTELIRTLAKFGYMGAAKATMAMLGVDVGPARLPNASLNKEQISALHRELETIGFFDWTR